MAKAVKWFVVAGFYGTLGYTIQEVIRNGSDVIGCIIIGVVASASIALTYLTVEDKW
jgi:hypothetical protein